MGGSGDGRSDSDWEAWHLLPLGELMLMEKLYVLPQGTHVTAGIEEDDVGIDGSRSKERHHRPGALPFRKILGNAMESCIGKEALR